MRYPLLYFFLFLALMGTIPAVAGGVSNGTNDTTKVKKSKGVWTWNTKPAITFNEKYLNNWSSAGNSLISTQVSFDATRKYVNKTFTFDNVVNLGVAYDWQDLDGNQNLESQRKSLDKMNYTSTFSLKLKDKWNFSFSLVFSSQFFEGYTYRAAGNADSNALLISRFLSPGYITPAIGIEYKEKAWNASIAPLSGKFTIVRDDDVIANGYLYGVDTTGGNRLDKAVGTYLRFYYKNNILPKLNLYTRLELFYDYRKHSRTDWTKEDPKYDTWLKQMQRSLIHETDVTFEFALNFNMLKWLSFNVTLNMKYDTDFAGISERFGHWQMYEMAGLSIFWSSNQEDARLWKARLTK